MVKVSQMTGRSGKPVANQFVVVGVPGPFGTFDGLTFKSGDLFQSYGSMIAFREYTGKTVLDRDKWDYSATTGKYRNQFLGECKKDTERKIKSGEYVLASLN